MRYFSGPVKGPQWCADGTSDRPDVDDDTTFPRQHCRQEHVDHPRYWHDVAGDEVVDDPLAADVGERLAEVVAHAHVVNQNSDIQISQFRRHSLVDGAVLGEVHRDYLDLDGRLQRLCNPQTAPLISSCDTMRTRNKLQIYSQTKKNIAVSWPWNFRLSFLSFSYLAINLLESAVCKSHLNRSPYRFQF